MIEITEKEFYHMRKRANVCPKCGKVDAYTMGNRTMCAECAERAREKAERRRQDPEKRVVMYDGVKKLKRARKDAGLCPDCGKRKPMDDKHVKCVIRNNRQMAYRHKRRGYPIPRGEYGICWQCNKKEVVPGKRLCPECYAHMAEITALANEARRKKKEETWNG